MRLLERKGRMALDDPRRTKKVRSDRLSDEELLKRAQIARRRDSHKKRAYDMQYREDNQAALKVSRAAYHQTEKGQKISKIAKAKRRAKPGYQKAHNEYCKRPDQRAKEKVNRHKRIGGEYWESIQIIMDIKTEFVKQVPLVIDRRKARGCYQRSIKRRAWKRHILYGFAWNY